MKAPDINNTFDEMLHELEIAPRLYRPSMFWENLNAAHIRYIKKRGINLFKRSINRTYFHWGVSEFCHQLSPISSELQRGNLLPIIGGKLVGRNISYTTEEKFTKLVARFLRTSRLNFLKIPDSWLAPLSLFESATLLLYKIYISYLYDYISRSDQLGLLKKLSEPRVGGPLLVRYRGSVISQDLCNSVHEFYSITKESDINKELKIGEIGAGYGRLAYVFLKALRKSSYCIIDIPPALFISQEYFKKLFPREKIFLFRPFTNFKEIEHEFVNARIKFLLPHQIEYLPKDCFDIMINISSLHEMRGDQISNYIKQEDRLTQGFVYLKQWKKARAKDNNFIREEEYPIPLKWKKIFHRTHPIQNLFFEVLYRTR